MPTTAERGYGTEHRNLRKHYARFVAGGQAFCARCLEPIHPYEAWDLGHDDFDRRVYTGPEHRRCNRATMKHRADRRRVRSRVW